MARGKLRYPVILVFCVLCALLVGCSKTGDIVVVTKELKSQTMTNMAVPDEFGTFASASTNQFWIEGTVRNNGTEDAHNVLVSFKCRQGAENRVLSAELETIPAGKTINFRTRPLDSKIHITLKEEEEPEIRFLK